MDSSTTFSKPFPFGAAIMFVTEPLVVVSCDDEMERKTVMLLLDRLGVNYNKFEKTDMDRDGNDKTVYCLDVWIR